MSDPVSRLNATLQDRAARVTVAIFFGALAVLSHVTSRKHRLFDQ